MFDLLNRIFSPIDPEVLTALRSKVPNKVAVSFHKEPSGQYVASVVYDEKKRPVMTQGNTGEELIDMVNDVVYTMIDIPEKYRPYLPMYNPPEDIQKELAITIPKKYLDKEIHLAKA